MINFLRRHVPTFLLLSACNLCSSFKTTLSRVARSSAAAAAFSFSFSRFPNDFPLFKRNSNLVCTLHACACLLSTMIIYDQWILPPRVIYVFSCFPFDFSALGPINFSCSPRLCYFLQSSTQALRHKAALLQFMHLSLSPRKRGNNKAVIYVQHIVIVLLYGSKQSCCAHIYTQRKTHSYN